MAQRAAEVRRAFLALGDLPDYDRHLADVIGDISGGNAA